MYKSGKPSHYLFSYCTISLLNTDLKLYAKLLATCLAAFMPTRFHPDQVGFIPHRQASDRVRRFIDLIHWADHNQTPSLLISLNAEKAFDRVHWRYLESVLQKFGINGPFLYGILGLYSTPSVRVSTSGFLFTLFPISHN